MSEQLSPLFKKLTICFIITGFATSCATNPDKISASYVSPAQYSNYSCNQISQEMARVERRVVELTGKQRKAATGDAVAMGIGLILFWPALFFLIGKDKKDELARLKGEYESLQIAWIDADCASENSVSRETIVTSIPNEATIDESKSINKSNTTAQSTPTNFAKKEVVIESHKSIASPTSISNNPATVDKQPSLEIPEIEAITPIESADQYFYLNWVYSDDSASDVDIRLYQESGSFQQVIRRGERDLIKLNYGELLLFVEDINQGKRQKPNWDTELIRIQPSPIDFVEVLITTHDRKSDIAAEIRVIINDKEITRKRIRSK